METPSAYLGALAGRIAAACQAHARPVAALLAGSAATGASDYYSDLDMSVFYDTPPSDAQLAAVRADLGATDFRLLAPRSDTAVIEDYYVAGVECQVVHVTRAGWEADMARVLVDLDVASPLQKALGGFLEAVPLYGEAQLAAWRATLAAYPDALAQAMVTHYLDFFPIWYYAARFADRDMALWTRDICVESSYHVLGVLAGLNRCYFTPFQFKRMQHFLAGLRLAPPDLGARLTHLLTAPYAEAVPALEALVGETVALVEAHLPAVDTSRVRRRLGARQAPWTPDEGRVTGDE